MCAPKPTTGNDYVDSYTEYESGEIHGTKKSAPAFPFAVPQAPDLTDDAVKAARKAQLMALGNGRKSTFLDGGAAESPQTGKSFLGG